MAIGFLIPDSEMSKADLRALRLEIANNLLEMASRETHRPRSEFVVRDAFPKDDFGFNGCEWENQTAISAADTWTKDWTKELPKNKFVAFYGFIYHAAHTLPGAGAAEGYPYLGLSYKLGATGATTREQVHLQQAYREYILAGGSVKFPVGYHKPVYYKGAETIYISLIANATVSQYAEDLELLTMVCEPYGEVISRKTELMPEQTSMIIPEEDMTVAEIKALREETKRRLVEIAAKETGKPASDFVVRDIFPKDDFDFNGVEWQNQTAIGSADTWTKDWSKKLPKTKFVAFYGVDYPVGDATPAAWKYMGVRYGLGSTGATTLKQVHIQKCQRYGAVEGATAADVEAQIKSARGYHRPVYYKGTDTIYLSLIANATVTQYYENLQLLGLVAEPYGAVISG